MQRLFSQPSFHDFGPGALHGGSKPVIEHVEGPRPSVLRRELRVRCPREPGIYGMVDLHGELTYVGKAKNLRARLLTYFRPRSRDRKASRIVKHTSGILWETSADEFAALHRELELIRRWRPRFNVQGKPHQWQHTYVCLGRPPAPHAFLARRPPAKVLAWFGPISAGRGAREAVRRLNDWFRLRDCPSKQEMVFAEQTELFEVERVAGCMRLELATCLGPCAAACSKGDYLAQIRAARDFLEGRNVRPLVELERAMTQAAEAQEYERAAVLRDKFRGLSRLFQQLEQLRQAASMKPMVYQVANSGKPARWYLVQHGRAVAAADVPTCEAQRDQLVGAWRAHRPKAQHGGEHLAGVMLLAAWFRRHPAERQKLVPLG